MRFGQDLRTSKRSKGHRRSMTLTLRLRFKTGRSRLRALSTTVFKNTGPSVPRDGSKAWPR
jgi:hypothetical protein